MNRFQQPKQMFALLAVFMIAAVPAYASDAVLTEADMTPILVARCHTHHSHHCHPHIRHHIRHHMHHHHSHHTKGYSHGMSKDFKNAEEWVKVFNDPARDVWQKPDEVVEALNVQPNDVVADIGAGTGYFSFRIAKKQTAAKIYAADIQPDMIEFLKKEGTTQECANVVPLLIPNSKVKFPEPVNLALIVDTFHHIDERINYFRSLKKTLAKDSRVAVIDYKESSPIGPPVEHRISKEEVIAELNAAGYKLTEDKDLLPNQYFLIFTQK
jgi:ubiquinone/menaquinone biosynthesis C-methylase UbiE